MEVKEKGEIEKSVWFIMSAYQYAHSAIFLYVFQSAASSYCLLYYYYY